MIHEWREPAMQERPFMFHELRRGRNPRTFSELLMRRWFERTDHTQPRDNQDVARALPSSSSNPA